MGETERKYWLASAEVGAGRWVRNASDDITDELLFTYYNSETTAQIDGCFRFYELGVDQRRHPRLELFSDGWLGLAELGTPFLNMLAALDPRPLGRIATPDDIMAGLRGLGFLPQDATAKLNSSQPEAMAALLPDKHARVVFHSDGSGNARPDDPSIAPGWYYAIGEEAAVGPFPTSREAHNECRDELVRREAGR